MCVSLHTPTHQQAMSCTPDISSRGLLSKYLGNDCLHSCARQTRCVLTEKLGTFVVGWDHVELTAAFPPSPSVGPSTPTPVLPPAPGLCVGARSSGVESASGCASASRGSGIAAWFPRLICSQARGRQIVLGGSVEFSLHPGAGSFWPGSHRASRCSCPECL